jgi:hypothetical protein
MHHKVGTVTDYSSRTTSSYPTVAIWGLRLATLLTKKQATASSRRAAVTGPNTLGVVPTHSGYTSESSSMRGVLFGTLDTFYFQQNTSPYISRDTDTTMTHYDTGGLKFLSTIRCSSFGEPFSHPRLSNRRYPLFGAIIATYDYILNYTTKCTIITKLSPPRL